MKGIINTVQKRIGLLVGSIGLVVVIANITNQMQQFGHTFFETLQNVIVWLLFLSILPFILSVFIESLLLKNLQIIILFFTGIMNILTVGYVEFYGPAMFLAGWLLMRHYGFLDTYPRTKNIIILGLLVGFTQISAAIHNTGEGAYAGLTTLAFFLFLIVLILILWWDMLTQQRLLQKENLDLKMNYGKLSEKIAEIEENKEPYDLKAVGITPAQRRVIRVLTVYKASNREIAERLNISEATVKLHLYNIYNKIGVDNRFAVIDLCKYNFPD